MSESFVNRTKRGTHSADSGTRSATSDAPSDEPAPARPQARRREARPRRDEHGQRHREQRDDAGVPAAGGRGRRARTRARTPRTSAAGRAPRGPSAAAEPRHAQRAEDEEHQRQEKGARHGGRGSWRWLQSASCVRLARVGLRDGPASAGSLGPAARARPRRHDDPRRTAWPWSDRPRASCTAGGRSPRAARCRAPRSAGVAAAAAREREAHDPPERVTFTRRAGSPAPRRAAA